jgi:hypothetical protein
MTPQIPGLKDMIEEEENWEYADTIPMQQRELGLE